MTILNALIESMISLPGARGVAIVDIKSGQTIAQAGQVSPEVLEIAGVANARLLRFKMGLAGEQFHQNIEDILVTLTDDYHLIRLVRRPGRKSRQYLYLVLNRSAADVELSRQKLMEIEERLTQSSGAFRLMDIECDYVLDLDNIRSKIERMIASWDTNIFTESEDEEDIPSYMQTDSALKILGVDLSEQERLTIFEHPTHNRRT